MHKLEKEWAKKKKDVNIWSRYFQGSGKALKSRAAKIDFSCWWVKDQRENCCCYRLSCCKENILNHGCTAGLFYLHLIKKTKTKSPSAPFFPFQNVSVLFLRQPAMFWKEEDFTGILYFLRFIFFKKNNRFFKFWKYFSYSPKFRLLTFTIIYAKKLLSQDHSCGYFCGWQSGMHTFWFWLLLNSYPWQEWISVSSSSIVSYVYL